MVCTEPFAQKPLPIGGLHKDQPCCANAGLSFSIAWKSGAAPQLNDQKVSVLMVMST